jgi:hypothetical protein
MRIKIILVLTTFTDSPVSSCQICFVTAKGEEEAIFEKKKKK